MIRVVPVLIGFLVVLTGCGAANRTEPPLTAAAGTTAASATQPATSSVRTCSELSGEGSATDPVQLGEITRKTVVRACAPLTSGKPYDVRYFSFTLRKQPGIGATAGARFVLSDRQSSGANPWLIRGAVTVKESAAGEWVGESPNYTGRFLRIDDVPGGDYVLGFEKLTSPLGALSSPPFDVEIDPR